MFPHYFVIALYILLAIFCYLPRTNLHWFYTLCTAAISGHMLIIATYPNTNQAAIITLAAAIFTICNYILTRNKNITAVIFTAIALFFAANTKAFLPSINLHIITSCILGSVTTIAALQSYCILIQNHRLKQATTPEENLLPLTMLGKHLRNTAIAGLILTTAIAASGLYNLTSASNISTIKIVLTLIIWLLFAVLTIRKSIIKISLVEKSFLMVISVLLSSAACGFCIYLG